MPDLSQLKKFDMLQGLTDDMLDRLASLLDHLEVDKGGLVFRQNDGADRFFFLSKGKIVLSVQEGETISIAIMTVEAGEAFGWTSILGGRYYTATAEANQDSVLFSVQARDLTALLESEPVLGYRFMKTMAKEINTRLQKRTNQLVKALVEHLDVACRMEDMNRAR